MTDEQPSAVDTGDVDIPSETTLRRAHVVDLYRKGCTFQQIGDELGVTRQRANKIYWEAMDAVLDKAVSARRAEMAEQLEEVVRVASVVMAKDHEAHSNGRLVTHEDGSAVLDDGPKLDAGRTIIAAQARFSKLIGADAVVKVETDSTLRYEVIGISPDDVV